jgi:hypothetical protein
MERWVWSAHLFPMCAKKFKIPGNHTEQRKTPKVVEDFNFPANCGEPYPVWQKAEHLITIESLTRYGKQRWNKC